MATRRKKPVYVHSDQWVLIAPDSLKEDAKKPSDKTLFAKLRSPLTGDDGLTQVSTTRISRRMRPAASLGIVVRIRALIYNCVNPAFLRALQKNVTLVSVPAITY